MTSKSPGQAEQRFDRKVAELLKALGKVPPRRGISYHGRPPGSTFGREGQALVTRLLTATSRDMWVATENFTADGLYVLIAAPVATLSGCRDIRMSRKWSSCPLRCSWWLSRRGSTTCR